MSVHSLVSAVVVFFGNLHVILVSISEPESRPRHALRCSLVVSSQFVIGVFSSRQLFLSTPKTSKSSHHHQIGVSHKQVTHLFLASKGSLSKVFDVIEGHSGQSLEHVQSIFNGRHD